MAPKTEAGTTAARIRAREATLAADVRVPDGARGMVMFAHGSGSGRLSPRNRQVARALNQAGLATVLLDLLTEDEERFDEETAELRFDIPFLSRRLSDASDWAREQGELAGLSLGYFGASTGAAAALTAAGERDDVFAVVSRGGRPDLAWKALPRVTAPTLLIVGGNDEPVIAMNKTAARMLKAEHRLEVIPGATHLFEEPGALEEVSRLAADWFVRHLPAR